jgi:DNA uptake protein ComE-like DNA-binding protein
MKAFFTGIGLGAAIGLWLAPASGSETRKKLITSTADLAARLEKKFEGKSEQLDNPAHLQTRADENAPAAKAEARGDNHETSSPDPVAEVLNSASKTQLRKVPGIGDATARRIIDSRPYESEAEVVENKVIPESVLKKLKDKLVDADEGVA